MIAACFHEPNHTTRIDSAHNITYQLCAACAADYDAGRELACGHDNYRVLWYAGRTWLVCDSCRNARIRASMAAPAQPILDEELIAFMARVTV